jgi:uncharacterized protein (TIGR03067 family)
MRNTLLTGLVCIGLCVLGFAARAADEEKTELEGVWEQTKLVIDGAEKTVAPNTRLIIRGHTSTLQTGDKVSFRGEFKLDATKTPKTSVGTYTDGPNKGKKSETIYKLDGDKVIFCRGPIDGARPTDFVSKPGSGTLLSEYKRVEK